MTATDIQAMDQAKRQQLNQVLAQLETQAYKMAYALTQNRDDALELVQESMLKLVQKYAAKPADEWTLLFYRILQNKIRDFHRRQGVRQLFSVFLSTAEKSHEQQLQQLPDPHRKQPDQALQQSDDLQQIFQALGTLPLRQQQTFLLRAWQQFSTRETAYALSISEGSVKTHYNRALKQLRLLLGEQHERL